MRKYDRWKIYLECKKRYEQGKPVDSPFFRHKENYPDPGWLASVYGSISNFIKLLEKDIESSEQLEEEGEKTRRKVLIEKGKLGDKLFCEECVHDPETCGRNVEDCKKEAELYFKISKFDI